MPNTPVPAAGEAMPAANLTTRRAILTGTAATAVTLAATSIPAEPAAAPSPIRVLFAEWQKIHDHMHDDAYWRSRPGKAGDEEMTRVCEDEHALAKRIATLPPRDPGDFAMKVIAATDDGTLVLNPDDCPFGEFIIADARALIAQTEASS